MASGSWTFSTANKYITGRVRWSSTSNGNLYNSSKVTIYLDYKKSSSSSEQTNGGYKATLYCKGPVATYTYAVSVGHSTFKLEPNNKWVNIASYTFTAVKHNTSGAASCTLGMQNGHCTNGNSLSAEQTSTKAVTLDAITLTAPTVTTTIDNINQRSLRVNWSTNTYYNKVEYNVNGGAYKVLHASTTTKSGNFTLSSLTPGTKYTVNVRVTRTDAPSKVTIKGASATTVAMPSITIPNLNFELGTSASNLTIAANLLDKGSVYAKYSFVGDNNTEINLLEDTLARSSSVTSGNINLNLNTEDYINIICGYCINKSSIPIKLLIQITILDNTVYTYNYSGTISIPNTYGPTFTNFNLVNTDTKSAGALAGVNGVYIPQGIGNLQIQIPPSLKGVAQKSATMKNYKVQIFNSDGSLISENTFNYSANDTALYTIGTTNTVSTFTVKVFAIDSRNVSSAAVSKNFTVLAYSAPDIYSNDFNLTRYNNFEDQLVLTLNYKIANVMINNVNYNNGTTISYVGAKTSNLAVFSDETLSGTISDFTITNKGTYSTVAYNKDFLYNENTNSIVSIDKSQVWNFTFEVSDNFSTVTRTITIEQGIPILAIINNGYIGVNKVPDLTDMNTRLQVDGDISAMTVEGTIVKFLDFVENYWQRLYPVGAIYMSVTNVNPSTFLGGTWVAWGSGRVPVGVNTSDSNFNTVEKTGGASTHKLTEAQMPSHTHTVSGTAASNGAHTHRSAYKRVDVYGSGSMDAVHWTNYSDGEVTTSSAGAHTHSVSGTAAAKGGGGAHNNLQPYITCYMWKRTA